MQISRTALLAGSHVLVMVKLLSGTEEWITDWAASHRWSSPHLDKTANSVMPLGTSFVQQCLPVCSHFGWKTQTFPLLTGDISISVSFGVGAGAKGKKTSVNKLYSAKSSDYVDGISIGRPKQGTRDPLGDANQQNTISQQEATTHSPSAWHLWLFFAASGHAAEAWMATVFQPYASLAVSVCRTQQGSRFLLKNQRLISTLRAKALLMSFIWKNAHSATTMRLLRS